MTPKQAWREAWLTVGIACLLVWGPVFYFLYREFGLEAWPVYVLLLAVTLPLVFMVQYKYQRGTQGACEIKSPRFHMTWMILLGVYSLQSR